jgi:hypothetical protein
LQGAQSGAPQVAFLNEHDGTMMEINGTPWDFFQLPWDRLFFRAFFWGCLKMGSIKKHLKNHWFSPIG